MFFDVELLTHAVGRLSLAMDDGRRWTIKFADFGFYSHDYGNSA